MKTLWFYGLSGVGKTTLANIAIEYIRGKEVACVGLDGDDLRQGLCSDLGFDENSRTENVRRAAHIAKLYNDNSIMVVASFMTPLLSMREMVAKIIPDIVYVLIDCPIDICIKRDPKGLYARHRKGEVTGMYGIDRTFEVDNWRHYINTEATLEDCTRGVKVWLSQNILSTLDDGILYTRGTNTLSVKSTRKQSYQFSSW